MSHKRKGNNKCNCKSRRNCCCNMNCAYYNQNYRYYNPAAYGYYQYPFYAAYGFNNILNPFFPFILF